MKRLCLLWMVMAWMQACHGTVFPKVTESATSSAFPLVGKTQVAPICTDIADHSVVGITATMLADDIERVTGRRPKLTNSLPKGPTVVAGTLGRSPLADALVKRLNIDVSGIKGKWESFVIATAEHPKYHTPLLVIVGSDRRGTAYGLTSLSEAIGVSPWYWWADVTPSHKATLYVASGSFVQKEPSVQYRGIFINDERFGGWARWAEQHFENETGKVGPKTYRQVFELLLRLKANYLWPAMHPGTQAFNADPENAKLADQYAIVMGSSHCEQMLRNNEGEWKAVNEAAKRRGEPGLGDFNYITNKKVMQDYWEERVRTNGCYENTYTLGLRGIHDYPMEGANSTEERVRLMQQAMDDQRDMLRRNISKPIEDIPQVLCTYEEVLDAYHNGLVVPDDVTLLWSDDKHGYCRNLCNPQEMKRKGGAGIYYHLSYHGDPASWIWLSPLSPAFIATELTKAYAFGARKIWVFNVGDIKPAEKELSFAMELAWDVERWQPTEAHRYIPYWAEKTFGHELAGPVARLMARYYRLQAGGKDAHVWFVQYTEQQVDERLEEAHVLEAETDLLAQRVPQRLQDAYFELVHYPVRGAAMLNEYQLLARRSMACATRGDSLGAMADAARVRELFGALNEWTRRYNEKVQGGKWREFFSWQPYHWFRSEKMDVPIATEEDIRSQRLMPKPQFLSVADATGCARANIESPCEADVPLWIEAVTPIRNFSKAPQDNVFCQVSCTPYCANGTAAAQTFTASATPINNVWHAPFIGPMWSMVGKLHLKKGDNQLALYDVKEGTHIDRIFLGLWPPFDEEPRLRIAACEYHRRHDSREGRITRVEGLGYADGIVTLPFDTPSYEATEEAPYVEYDIDMEATDRLLEVRTLPTLRVYEGRQARYAVQIGNGTPQTFSIHEDDFTAAWRQNVLRGYASRYVALPDNSHLSPLNSHLSPLNSSVNSARFDMKAKELSRGPQRVRIYLLDPGVVLQEVLVYR